MFRTLEYERKAQRNVVRAGKFVQVWKHIQERDGVDIQGN